MEIKRNQNTNAINFEYLFVGTVFRYSDDNTLFMRIKNIKVDDYVINAIDLEDGESICFSDCDTVTVIGGEFVTNV